LPKTPPELGGKREKKARFGATDYAVGVPRIRDPVG
jgi:hypothetical protein